MQDMASLLVEDHKSGSDAAHVVCITFSGQGSINPFLRFAKILSEKGLFVTFVVTEHVGERMLRSNTTQFTGPRLKIEFISDGLQADADRSNLGAYLAPLSQGGAQSFALLLNKLAANGRPVTAVVSNPFIPWASRVAVGMGIPCGLLWTMPAGCFLIYREFMDSEVPKPGVHVELPGLPPFTVEALPTSLLPERSFPQFVGALKETFAMAADFTWILANTFAELETATIQSTGITPVGPINISGEASGDMWTASSDCLTWLDSHPLNSVIYVSFGSVATVSDRQMEETAYGLELSGKPFLWVVKPPAGGRTGNVLPEGFMERIAGRGMVVQWSPQTKVLVHPSVACFMTHCGWNSSLESLVAGMPVLGVPQFGDQTTNAWLLADVFGVGIRLAKGEGGVVGREEVARGIREATEGAKALVMRENAEKWKKVARDAVGEGGSTTRSVQDFVDEIHQRASSKDSDK